MDSQSHQTNGKTAFNIPVTNCNAKCNYEEVVLTGSLSTWIDQQILTEANGNTRQPVPTSTETPNPELAIRSARDLTRNFPEMRESIIEGLIRRGETLNIIASPKTGKSWLSLCLAISIAVGLKWLGKFWTRQGRVLIVDNELHPETSSMRLSKVAEAMGLVPDQYLDNVDFVNVRGQLMDLPRLGLQLRDLVKPGTYTLIILDAWYRFIPEGSDENSNADVSAMYNLLDSIAGHLDCAFVAIHHTSKGDQSSKSVTDVGSGAGAQSRAADAHMVLRAHVEPGVVVVDATVRSFQPMESFCLKWLFPTWIPADDLDPRDLKQAKPSKIKASTSKPQDTKEDRDKQVALGRRAKILEAYEMYPDGETMSVISSSAGMSTTIFRPVNDGLIREKKVIKCDVVKGKKPCPGFRLAKAVQASQTGQTDTLFPVCLPQVCNGGDGSQTGSPPLGGPVSLSASPTLSDQDYEGDVNQEVPF